MFNKTALRQIRKERGMSRRELAAEIKRHPSTVTRWEQGIREPNSHSVIVLAHVLDCSVNELEESI